MTTNKQNNASSAPVERRVMQMMHNLPAGYKYEPLHKFYPKCGVDLSQQTVKTETNKNKPQHIKCDTGKGWIPWVACKDAARLIKGWAHEGSLKRVINPFAKTYKETTERNYSGWFGWVRNEKPSTYSQENNNTHNHKYMIPIFNSKFRKWVIHVIAWLRR
jgi:hypothetical protein